MGLGKDRLEAFHRDGFLCPVSVLTPGELIEYQARVANIIAGIVSDPAENKRMQYKAHLLYTSLDELIRHPAMLDAVESLLGPDILVWNSGFLVKPPRDPSFVSWHQDATYWGLEPMDVASAWLALSDSTEANGCVLCVPGTHRLAQVPHKDTFAKDNMLSRGQRIGLDVAEAEAVPLVLRAGEMSLHHVLVVHGSRPNRSDGCRTGFIVNFIAPHVRQKGGADSADSATLVRGMDRFGHFEREPRPERDLDPAAIEAHERVMRRQMAHILA